MCNISEFHGLVAGVAECTKRGNLTIIKWESQSPTVSPLWYYLSQVFIYNADMCQELFGSYYHCKVLLSLPSRKLISVILELTEHFIRHKEMYAILVIRLKQSKSLHLIQTRLRCDDLLHKLSWTFFSPCLALGFQKYPLKT